MKRLINKVALAAFQRIHFVAFWFSLVTVITISYSYYLRLNGGTAETAVLVLSPLFALGMLVIGIVFYGRSKELKDNSDESAKLQMAFRKLTLLYLLAVSVIIFGTLLTAWR
jgi:hypothetical protein